MQKKKVNPWSLVAILFAFGFCPLFTLASILLGIRALIDIKAKGDTRGIRLAWVAIFVGSLTTGFWGGGMLWWNLNVRARIEQGPIVAIMSGQDGDIETFESAFISPGTSADTTIFLDEVQRRYGRLLGGGMDQEIEESPVDGTNLFLGMVPMNAELVYVLHFESKEGVHLTGKFELFHTGGGGNQFMNRFAWIRIDDEELGNLVYPVMESMEERVPSGK